MRLVQMKAETGILRKCLRVVIVPVCVTILIAAVYLFTTDIGRGMTHSFQFFSGNTSTTPITPELKTSLNPNKPINILSRVLQRPPCPPAKGSDQTIPQSGRCRFCEGRHIFDGKWFNFSTIWFRLYTYTAIYDDRPSLLSNPVIRIVAVSDIAEESTLNRLSCRVYHSKGTINVPLVNPEVCGPQIDLQPYVYTCQIPPGILPVAVSIQGRTPVLSCMPVEYPTKPTTPSDFAVCVPVAFGDIDPLFLIEWMEMQKILGVSLVGIYDHYIGPSALKVLKYYAKKGFVDLRKSDSIYHSELENVLQSATVLNDCYYRHMYDAKWIIINDVDEFIQPLKTKTLKELVDYLEKNITLADSSLSANFVIRNSYFLFEHPPDTNISSHLKFLQYRMRAPVSGLWHRVKPIIHAMSCTSMFNHVCLGATANYTKRNLIESIDPDIALTMHYRKCPEDLSPNECTFAFKLSQPDNFILIYKDELKQNVESKIQEIMGALPQNWT